MATYIVLFNWTEQGIRNYRDSPQRTEDFRQSLEKGGAQLRDMWWTSGQYDIVGVIDAPNGQKLSALLLELGARGNVRTTTMRGFSADEFREMIGQSG